MDENSHENLRLAQRIVREHKFEQPFDKKLMTIIGCELQGEECKKCHKKYGQCTVVNIPAKTSPELKNFVVDGVISCPCAWCGNWIFYRQKEFPYNATMQPHYEKAGWHRTQARHFACPNCNVWDQKPPAKVV